MRFLNMLPTSGSPRLFVPRRLALASLLVLLCLTFASPTTAQDCPGDIGCTYCKLRWPRGAPEPFYTCPIESVNGHCACFTWFIGDTEVCGQYGTCINGGWQGGGPPTV